jgi:hypothetical protein
MLTDTVTWGETYDLAITANDLAGDPIVVDATWTAAARFTRGFVGGDLVLDLPLPITAGVPTGSIDTGEEPWTPGNYYYDVRLTDPAGNDYWSGPVLLQLADRNTPSSLPPTP